MQSISFLSFPPIDVTIKKTFNTSLRHELVTTSSRREIPLLMVICHSRLCGSNFFVHSLFFQACLKTLGFLSHLFTINNFKPGFWVGSPQTTIKRLGTTTCGSLSRSKCWEPQPVVPNQNQKVGNHNLWFPIKINMLGTTTCGSQSKSICWEPQSVVPNKN